MTIYIITFRYIGESGSGVVGAYAKEEEAKKVMHVLENHGDMSKVFEITAVEDVPVET